MELPTLDQDLNIESFIKKMKATGFDFATKEQMISHFSEYFYSSALTKMLDYKLITKDVEHDSMYVLTERGANFKSFNEERKKHKREEYMKESAYFRAKYWWAFAIAGGLLGWGLKVAETKLTIDLFL